MRIITLHGNFDAMWIKDTNGNTYRVRRDNYLSNIYFGVMHTSNGYENGDTAKYYNSPSTYFDMCLAKFEEDEDGQERLTEKSAAHRLAFLRQHASWFKQREAILKNPGSYHAGWFK